MALGRSSRAPWQQAAAKGAVVFLVVGFISVLMWAGRGSLSEQQAVPLFEAPAAAAQGSSAGGPGGAGNAPTAAPPRAPTNIAPAATQPRQPVDAKKQVPRVDLVISHLSDQRGMIEPCG